MTQGRLRVRLLLAVAAFAGWIGYMGYLVATRPTRPDDAPLVLSRAQLLASDADVIAFVNANPGAIGYVSAAAASGSVKVLTVTE